MNKNNIEIYFRPNLPEKIINREYVMYTLALMFLGIIIYTVVFLNLNVEIERLKKGNYDLKESIEQTNGLLSFYYRPFKNKISLKEYEYLIIDEDAAVNMAIFEKLTPEYIQVERMEYFVEEKRLDITAIFYSRMDVLAFDEVLNDSPEIKDNEYDDLVNLSNNRVETNITMVFTKEGE